MSQNSGKVARKKKVYVFYVGKRFTLHDFLRYKAKLKKFGGDNTSKSRKLRTPVLNRPLKLPRGYLPRRPKTGPMTNVTRVIKGRRIITDTNQSGVVTTTVQSVPDLYDQLSNVVTGTGDFKHPNYQSFTHWVYSDYGGIQEDVAFNTGGIYNVNLVAGRGIAPNPTRTWTGSFDTGVYNQALSRLYEKLRGDIDISIDLAEFGRTKAMMRDTVRAMGNLARTFRKMKRSNPRDWGNLWLEYTYGWKPLASTIYGVAKKLMVPGSQGPGFIHVTATAKQMTETGVARGNYPGLNLSGIDYVQRYYRTNRCRFDVRYQINSSNLAKLAGFTSLNPVSIAWELTPYSFVVDWFVNVGGYLRNFESALLYGSTFLEGYYTETALAECWSAVAGVNTTSAGGSGHTMRVQMDATERKTWKRRTPLSGTPFPRVPSFQPRLGASRLISGAALLGQMLHSLEHLKSWGDPRSPSVADIARKRAAGRAFETASKSFSNWEREMRRKNPPRIATNPIFDRGSFIP